MRTAVGEEIELCFDIHTRLDPPDAIQPLPGGRAVSALLHGGPHPLGEHAVPPGGAGARQHPLAVGEQFAGKWEFRQVIEEELTDYARVDLCIAGGLTESKKIAGWCETHYIKLATHNPLGPVSSAACLHLNLACSNVGVKEQPRRPGGC